MAYKKVKQFCFFTRHAIVLMAMVMINQKFIGSKFTLSVKSYKLTNFIFTCRLEWSKLNDHGPWTYVRVVSAFPLRGHYIINGCNVWCQQ